jgi:uncharacterized phage protein (TIGR01671 family)
MREIKFRYVLRNKNSKVLLSRLDDVDLELVARCQYTGLKDKNGVEIYEGDIAVQYEKPKHPFDIKQQIFFADGMFCIGRIGDTQTPLSMETDSRIYRGKKVNLVEVVGNIFENPVLLEEQ